MLPNNQLVAALSYSRSLYASVILLIVMVLLLTACSTASPTQANTPTAAATATPSLAPTATSNPGRKLTVMALPEDLQMLEGAYDLFQTRASQAVVSSFYLPVVATSPADLTWFKQLPPPLATIDWPNEIAVLIYMQGGSRNLYAINIKEMTQTGQQVRVDCEVKRPPPGTIETAIANYFVAAVVVRRVNFQPSGEINFSFYNQTGTLIAEAKGTVK